jgi:hypothetical protein
MDIDVPLWEKSIPFLLVYFAPVMIGAYRRWKDRRASWPVWKLFLLVLFAGWTVIGWLWALRMAFRDKSLPDWLTSAATVGSGGGGGGTSQPARDLSMPLPEPTNCPTCGGTGTHPCMACSGRGQWYDASGQGFCQTCVSSGKITCMNCRGTGKVG